FHFKIGIRSDGIFGRDRVVLYPDMKGPGHRHSLLSDLAYLKPRIRKTELAPKGEFNYRGRLSVFGRPAARADQAQGRFRHFLGCRERRDVQLKPLERTVPIIANMPRVNGIVLAHRHQKYAARFTILSDI